MPYLCFFAKTSAEGEAFPPFRRPAAAGETGPPGTGVIRHDMAWSVAAFGDRGVPPPRRRGSAGVHRREQKGTGHHMVSCPLLTSLTFLCAATPFGRAAKRGLRGLGSVRRAAFGTL